MAFSRSRRGGLSFVLLVLATFLALSPVPDSDTELFERLTALARDAVWKQTKAIRIEFDTHHPQGFARVGEYLYLSTVEVVDVPSPLAEPDDEGHNRTPGEGKGWLIKMSLNGKFVGSVQIGEGAEYHPGGIDYDGKWLWVPVAEYRRDSRSSIYRVDPETLEAQAVFLVEDHIGGLVHDRDRPILYGVSWGARRFYTWRLDGDESAGLSKGSMRHNPSHYIDYQDCQSLGAGKAVCTGLSSYAPGKNQLRFALGGLELIDFRSSLPLHQVPITLWTENGRVMTQNPSHFEVHQEGIRAYFMPEDQPSTLFIYEISTNR